MVIRRRSPAVLARWIVAGLLGCLPAVVPVPRAEMGDISGIDRAELWLSDVGARAEYLNQLDVQYIGGDWVAGCRLEMDEELRWDADRRTAVTRRFAEFSREGVSLRLGHQFLTLGRGLLLRAMEDEQIRVDRNLDGASGAVSWRAAEGRAFLGRPRDNETGLREALLFGGDGEVRLSDAVALGGGYVRRDATGESASENRGRPMEELWGGRVALSSGLFDGYMEGVSRARYGRIGPRGEWETDHEGDGQAWYASASMSLPSWAFVIEGKDYERFDVESSNPPTCDNAEKTLNGGFDERGLGLTATVSPTPDVVVSVASSVATARATNDRRVGLDASLRRDWPGRGVLVVGGEWADETGLQGHSGRKYWGPSLEATRYLTDRLGLSWKGRCLSRSDSLLGYVDEYVELESALTLSYARFGAATLSTILTTEPVREFDGRDAWTFLHLRYTAWDNCDLSVVLGRERGGITCSGGLCHYETPFTGLRALAIMRL